MNNSKEHVHEIQEVVVDTITTPITNIFKLVRSTLGLSVNILKGIETTIVTSITKKEK